MKIFTKLILSIFATSFLISCNSGKLSQEQIKAKNEYTKNLNFAKKNMSQECQTKLGNQTTIKNIYTAIQADLSLPAANVSTSSKDMCDAMINNIKITNLQGILKTKAKEIATATGQSQETVNSYASNFEKINMLCTMGTDSTKLKNLYVALKSENKSLSDAKTSAEMCKGLSEKLTLAEFFSALRYADNGFIAKGLSSFMGN